MAIETDDDAELPPAMIPGVSIPDGTEEQQLAWIRARIAEAADDEPVIEADLEEFFDDIKRRGRERLARERKAA